MKHYFIVDFAFLVVYLAYLILADRFSFTSELHIFFNMAALVFALVRVGWIFHIIRSRKKGNNKST